MVLPHQNLREQHEHHWQEFSSNRMTLWYKDCRYIICVEFFLVPRVSWILLVNYYIYEGYANRQEPVPTETNYFIYESVTDWLRKCYTNCHCRASYISRTITVPFFVTVLVVHKSWIMYLLNDSTTTKCFTRLCVTTPRQIQPYVTNLTLFKVRNDWHFLNTNYRDIYR